MTYLNFESDKITLLSYRYKINRSNGHIILFNFLIDAVRRIAKKPYLFFLDCSK